MIFAIPDLDHLSPGLVHSKLEGIQDNNFCTIQIVLIQCKHFLFVSF